MFSEISLNSILKDENLQWREKAIFKIFSLMIMMFKFEPMFFMNKIRTTTFERIHLRDLQ